MGWLCDVCGYENEFNEESHPAFCLCCGEPAPRNKIIEARRELKAYHRAEMRRILSGELGRQREIRRRKIDCITRGILLVMQLTPLVVILMIAISVVGAAVSFGVKNDARPKFGQAVEHFLMLSENVNVKREAHMDNCREHVEMLGDWISDRNKFFDTHAASVAETVGKGLKQIGGQLAVDIQEISSSSTNVKYNWHIFWNRAKGNVQELIYSII